jgi:hypothetical protein
MTIQLKIQLRGINNPPVWRRIIIPGNYTFEELHDAIQYEFGWFNEHLYQFQKEPYSRSWCITDLERNGDGYRERPKDAAKTKVGPFIKQKKLKNFTYLYDFGDDWVHDITVERIDEEADASGAVNQGGRGTCPPEDCGGPFRYEYMKKILKEQPDSEEAQDYREWLGLEDDETFDPDSYVENYIDDLVDDSVDDDEYKEDLSSNVVDIDKIEDTTLLNCMSYLNLGTLAEFADNMNLEINLNGNEDERRKELASQILSHAEQVLMMLPLGDLFILQKMKDNPTKSHTVRCYKDIIDPIMVIYGLARDFVGKDDYYYIQIPIDLWQQWEPYIDFDKTTQKDEEQVTRLNLEGFIEGMCNLYGKVSRSMMKDQLVSKGICENITKASTALELLGERSLLVKWITYNDEPYHTNDSDDKTYYSSRYEWDFFEEFDKELRKYRRQVKDYKDIPDYIDIIKASEYPVPMIPNNYKEDFEAYLQNTLEMDDADIMSICHHIWYYAQHEGEEEAVPPSEYFMDVLMKDTEQELETKEYVTAIHHLDNYLNNMPRWQLRGYTPLETGLMMSDIGSKFGQIHDIFSQHLDKQHNQSKYTDSFDDWLSPTKPYIAPKTPGRNDPCPCGSGKKYKNCCGRGN